MDFEMNRINRQMADRLTQNLRLKQKNIFCKTLVIILTVSILCLIAFHGTYFAAKNKFPEQTDDSINRNVRQIQTKSGKAMILLNNFESVVESETKSEIKIDICVISGSGNSTKRTDIPISENNSRQYITTEEIDDNQSIEIKIGAKIIALIPIKELSDNQRDGTIKVNAFPYSFYLKFIWK